MSKYSMPEDVKKYAQSNPIDESIFKKFLADEMTVKEVKQLNEEMTNRFVYIVYKIGEMTSFNVDVSGLYQSYRDKTKSPISFEKWIAKNKKKIEEAFKQAHAEAGAVYPLIIGGKKVETEKKIASVSPATKEVLGYACSCSKEQADEAIKASYEAFKKWSLTSVEERVRVLRRLAALLIENRFIMDAWNVLESGKN